MSFSIIAEFNSTNVNWDELNIKLRNFQDDSIEFFPIPDVLNAKSYYLGISVINKLNFNFNTIKNIINFLTEFGCKIFELYNSSEVNDDNINDVFSKYFK
jgi:hypothetical protein